MKKILLACFLAVFILSGFAYAQKDANQTESPEAKARVEELLSTAERYMWNPRKLNDTIHELRDKIPNRDVGVETRREATKRLIKIFYSIDDSLTNSANKAGIIEIVGYFDNSPEAHEFFLKVLSSGDARYRERALWSIQPGGVHGDDLYEKIKSLEQEKILSRAKSLMYLKSANPARALGEIQSFLKTTSDLKDFVIVGLNMSGYYKDDLNAMDIVIERYEEFKSKPVPLEYAGYPPDRAIVYPTLWKYIEAKEGAKLKLAIEIMKAKGVCGDDDIPRLDKKIKSHDVTTREAIIDFLDYQIGNGSLNKDKVAPVLDGARNRETNHKLKQRLEMIIKKNLKREGK